MKLDPEHLGRVARESTPIDRSAARGRVKGPESRGSAPVPGQPASDGLVLSAAADRFRQWRGRLESLPETARADRLAQLKALVASGGYSVGGEQIAQGMLDDPATAAALGLTPPQR